MRPAGPQRRIGAGQTHVRGSPNAWSLQRGRSAGLVYIPTGNPSPDYSVGCAARRWSATAVRSWRSTSPPASCAGRSRRCITICGTTTSRPSPCSSTCRGRHARSGVDPGNQAGRDLPARPRNGTPWGRSRSGRFRAGRSGERYSRRSRFPWRCRASRPGAAGSGHVGSDAAGSALVPDRFRTLRYQGRFTPPSLDDSLIFPATTAS